MKRTFRDNFINGDWDTLSIQREHIIKISGGDGFKGVRLINAGLRDLYVIRDMRVEMFKQITINFGYDGPEAFF